MTESRKSTSESILLCWGGGVLSKHGNRQMTVIMGGQVGAGAEEVHFQPPGRSPATEAAMCGDRVLRSPDHLSLPRCGGKEVFETAPAPAPT